MSRNKYIYIALGSIFVLVACFVSFFLVSNPNKTQYYVLIVFLSLGASAFVIALPGSINVDLPKGIHSTGVFAIFVLIIAFAPKWAPPSIELYQIKGKLQLADDESNSGILNDLDFAVTPPDVKPYDDGLFIIANVPIEPTKSEYPPKLIILKKGYKREYVTIQEIKEISKLNKYLITKGQSIFTIDPKTPIILQREKQTSQEKGMDYDAKSAHQPTRVDSSEGRPK